MSESGTKSGTTTRKVLLTRAAIEVGLDPTLASAIQSYPALGPGT